MMSEPQYFLGLRVDHWPSYIVCAVGVTGIFASFLLQGIAHEKLISHFKFSETLFLTFTQFFCYSILNVKTGYRVVTKKQNINAPLYIYIICAITLGLSMSLGNLAAMKLSYPTEVLFKSSKLIPVMIGNIIFLKKIPKLSDVISTCMIVVGLIGISLGDFRGKNKFDIVGIIAVTSALCFDAVASNIEDKILNSYNAPQSELVSVLYGIGALIVGIGALLNGEFISAINKIIHNPISIAYLFCFAFLGAIGVQFVYLIMKRFGSLITVMITSIRKAFTVCLSFLIYRDKKFTYWHGISLLIIAVGMTINIATKNMSKKTEDVQGLLENFEETEDEPIVFSEDDSI